MPMESKQQLAQAMQILRRYRSSLRLDAEVDPKALVEVADDVAELTGLPRDVALRVVEDELGVRPLPAHTPLAMGVTVMDLRPFLEE